MKKVIILILLLLFLSGCEAEYNVIISEKNIQDELIVNNFNISSWNQGNPSYKDRINGYYEKFNLAVSKDTPGYPEISSKIKGYNYYKKELINTTSNYGLKFSYSHNYNDYTKSPLLVFYGKGNITNNYQKLIIDSGSGADFTAFNGYSLLNELNINITSDYLVLNHNADKQENNTYSWKITKNNYQDKTIHIEIDKTRKAKTNLIDNKNLKYINTILIILGIFIILFIIRTLLKVSKSNR